MGAFRSLSLSITFFLLFAACSSKKESGCRASELLSSKETQGVEQRSSELRISVEQLQKWDEVVRALTKKSPLPRDGDEYRLYTYLYYAQRLFADNSFALTGGYSGSLDSISQATVNLFYPDFKTSIEKDLFSEELATLVMFHIVKRFEQEEREMQPISLSEREGHWKDEDPFGLHYPSMTPWALKRADEFASSTPPSQEDLFWKKQLEQTKEKSKGATASQKQKSLFWQRIGDPESADWRFIAIQYMNEESIPLEMQLEVRSKIMMGLIDALIAVFHDKYTYLARRPFMLDPSIKTLFPTPNHPTYPAAHGTMSGAAVAILSYYFPENQKQWELIGKEARESRLWGGIHFPIDLTAGEKQGSEIGKAVIFRY